MKKILLPILVLLCTNLASQAQSLKDLLNSSAVKETISALTGNRLTGATLPGTWQYSAPACQFESDDLLKKAGGSLVSSQIENKLADYYAKVGIQSGSFCFVFAADSTFSITSGLRTLSGVYTLDEEAQTLALAVTVAHTGIRLATLNTHVSLSGDKLSILFDADKILNLITLLANASGSSTLQAIGSLSGQYDGMRLGFELKK